MDIATSSNEKAFALDWMSFLQNSSPDINFDMLDDCTDPYPNIGNLGYVDLLARPRSHTVGKPTVESSQSKTSTQQQQLSR
jgi:hypothetical protein